VSSTIEGGGTRGRWWNLVGHYALYATAAIWGGLAGLYLATAAFLLSAAPIVFPAATLTLLAALVVAALAHCAHNGNLCARCIAAWPLDGSAEAERHRSPLARHHSVRPSLFAAVTAVAAMLVPDRPLLLLLAVAAAVLARTSVDTLRHSRLQPWCPWCQDDDGPFREPSPDPMPTPEMTR
jgi:hypothetical protein